jgi:predicted nucleotide-binding protein (sugar kinase/HSP70/actin superfamily)
LGPHNRGAFAARFIKVLEKHFGKFELGEVKRACKAAYLAYDRYMADIQVEGHRIINEARTEGKKIIVLAGRPYHADPEINHGIHKLISALGFAVVSEDAVASLVPKFKVNLLSQWTYHQRLFSAAKYVTTQEDMYLVHLVSFGCGLDALTSDEVRSLLEHYGHLYTQIKIDEVTNLGAIKIRLRSLIAAILQKSKEGENE